MANNEADRETALTLIEQFLDEQPENESLEGQERAVIISLLMLVLSNGFVLKDRDFRWIFSTSGISSADHARVHERFRALNPQQAAFKIMIEQFLDKQPEYELLEGQERGGLTTLYWLALHGLVLKERDFRGISSTSGLSSADHARVHERFRALHAQQHQPARDDDDDGNDFERDENGNRNDGSISSSITLSTGPSF